MNNYLELTERGRAQRLRRLALNALKAYDLDVEKISLVSNDSNGIFCLKTKSGNKWILRVTMPEGGHTLDHVMAEMDWLSALGVDTDLSVPHPLAASNGSMVVEASAEGVPEARLCEIFSWVPGVDLAERLTMENMQRLGELSARLHQHARSYQPPRNLRLLTYDRVFPFRDSIVLFDDKYTALVSSELKHLCEQAIQWVQTAIDGLMKCGEPMRIIHGDLHQWNVRIARGVLSPIDFEDLMWGWPVQDIATTLYYSQTAPDFTEKRAAFQKGYCRVQPWPERTPGEIDAFLAARGLGMFNFALQAKELPDIDMQAFAKRLQQRLMQIGVH